MLLALCGVGLGGGRLVIAPMDFLLRIYLMP